MNPILLATPTTLRIRGPSLSSLRARASFGAARARRTRTERVDRSSQHFNFEQCKSARACNTGTSYRRRVAAHNETRAPSPGRYGARARVSIVPPRLRTPVPKLFASVQFKGTCKLALLIDVPSFYFFCSPSPFLFRRKKTFTRGLPHPKRLDETGRSTARPFGEETRLGFVYGGALFFFFSPPTAPGVSLRETTVYVCESARARLGIDLSGGISLRRLAISLESGRPKYSVFFPLPFTSRGRV